MDANFEKPFDDFGYLELLLLYYDISKTVVFWTTVFLISSTLINGSFSQLCLAASINAEMAVRRIWSMSRMKPLDTKHLQEDTMLMRQQRHLEKNDIETSERMKRKMVEQEMNNERDEDFEDERLPPSFSDIIYWLVEELDIALGTKRRQCKQYCCERPDSMFEPTTKDRKSFRNLNTLTVGSSSTSIVDDDGV